MYLNLFSARHQIMHDFLTPLTESLADGKFISLTMSKPRGPRADDAVNRITVRLVEVKGQTLFQWTYQYSKREVHENLSASQVTERVAQEFGSVFKHAHLFTADVDIAARSNKLGDCRVTISPASKRAPASVSHDRQKQYLIPEGQPCPFLHELGVMTLDGRVHRSMQHKFRQINRFLEFVEDVIPHLPAEGTLDVVDFGCGLSYLTFALHHLLAVIHARDVRILGIDRNSQVIDRCTHTCGKLNLEGIEFTADTIDAQHTARKVHLAVALHACDTATDDALAQAVRWQADVILAAPCCQHELAPQLDSPSLSLLTRHGILRERLAAMATDALRAAILEQAGYRTQIIEFIDTEHTPKNLLLRAVRQTVPAIDANQEVRINEFKMLLGVDHIRLEELLAGHSSE
ncbi:MAG: SAM-dependent methyltransferase [Planctomycetaceae bacterium]|nr:SAM-dependent methyltransferase [Planctomycetaceae bacterium]